MFGHSLTLFTAFGVKVKVNLGWALIATLIAWSLAQGFFPQVYAGLTEATYWSMAVVALIGLAASIILHELSHSLVARAFGMPVESITLFMFGGVAELEEEPDSPRAELVMALAGPAMSLALAGLFHVLAAAAAPGSTALGGVLSYLAIINLVLAVFNLAPAFPMDGGRALRAILWARSGDIFAATRAAGRISGVIGLVLIGLGLAMIVSGGFVPGLWWILVGAFVQTAARGAVAHEASHALLTGHPVRRYMTAPADVVAPDLTLRELVDDHVYRFHHDVFPVVDGSSVLGIVGREQLKATPREDWETTRVGDVMLALNAAHVVTADADAADALDHMRKKGVGRLVVLDGDRLAGVLTLRDFLEVVDLRMDLEG